MIIKDEKYFENKYLCSGSELPIEPSSDSGFIAYEGQGPLTKTDRFVSNTDPMTPETIGSLLSNAFTSSPSGSLLGAFGMPGETFGAPPPPPDPSLFGPVDAQTRAQQALQNASPTSNPSGIASLLDGTPESTRMYLDMMRQQNPFVRPDGSSPFAAKPDETFAEGGEVSEPNEPSRGFMSMLSERLGELGYEPNDSNDPNEPNRGFMLMLSERLGELGYEPNDPNEPNRGFMSKMLSERLRELGYEPR